jgi:hypothetical protein
MTQMTVASASSQVRLILVCILNGLAPNAINPVDIPNLFRLRQNLETGEYLYYDPANEVVQLLRR